jgi:multidrug/hemolysin transport system ATP-binding protein
MAIVGPSGCGKTTLLKSIAGIKDITSGSFLWEGRDLAEDGDFEPHEIGYVPQFSIAYDELTVDESIENAAKLRVNASEDELNDIIDNVLAETGLTDIADRQVKLLSGGQKRRIDIARALLHSPELLILDEPTTGLDPQTRKTVWSVIDSLRGKYGITVFLTTHYMEEAAESDHVVIIDSGRIVAEGSPLDLKNRYAGDSLSLYSVSEDEVRSLNMPYTAIQGGYRIALPDTASATSLILSNPELFRDYELTKGKMDDVFLNVTGKKLTGGDGK